MANFIVRGLPDSIANDGWWLACDATPEPAPEHRRDDHYKRTTPFSRIASVLLIALILLADFLFWQHPVGLSLAVFSAALSGVAIYSLRPRFSAIKWAGFAGLWVACALPVVEFTQTASVLFLVVGHLGLLVWCAMQSQTWAPILRNLLRLPYLMTLFSFLPARAAVRNASVPGDLKFHREALLIWLLPVIASSVFLLLFVGANPIFEQWLDRAMRIDFSAGDPVRVLFWTCAAFAAYPFVAFEKLAENFKPEPARGLAMPKAADAVLNARSITISLFLFNAMFLTQNATDLAFLWGGAALPDGLTYARYAQQGAYPLMATSVLAGLFVLISRRFIPSAPLLKLLLLIWILQNIFLVFSALARLGLYVDAYGLTYLRVRAGIGMGLVMAGMALLGWQLWRKKSNAWVTAVFAGLCAVTVYSGCFVNFGYLIAHENLARGDHRMDIGYLCRTSPLVVGALLERAEVEGSTLCMNEAKHWTIAPEGWRDWGFRKGRLAVSQRAYLTIIATDGVTSQQPGFTKRSEEYMR